MPSGAISVCVLPSSEKQLWSWKAEKIILVWTLEEMLRVNLGASNHCQKGEGVGNYQLNFAPLKFFPVLSVVHEKF